MSNKKIIFLLIFFVLLLNIFVIGFLLWPKKNKNDAVFAEEQYVQAHLLWEQGKHQQAYEGFDFIVKQYPATSIADNALLMRNKLDEQYRAHYRDDMNAARNSHGFSKGVWQSLLNYRKAHQGRNPDSLQDLDIAQKGRFSEFLEQCFYDIAPRNKGIFLDCTHVNMIYAIHVAETGEDRDFENF